MFLIWGTIILAQEDKDTKECYYNICSDYADADFIDGVCGCYNYDVLGNLILEKTEVIRWHGNKI